MANVLNRTTLEYRPSVNTSEYDPADWIVNPTLPACDRKYWVVEGDTVREMTAEEKATTDSAAEAASLLANRQAAVAWLSTSDPMAVALRAAFKHLHKSVALKPGKPDRTWDEVVADIVGQILVGEGD